VAEILYIDFETRSEAELKDTGVHLYAEDASTRILCTGFAFDDEPPLLAKGDEIHPAVREHVAARKLVVAHNAAFELALWNLVGTLRYKWPKLLASQMSCTMARALAMGLPGALARCAPALGLDVEKDAKGHRTMLELCKPLEYVNGKPVYENSPEKFQRLYDYCLTDVVVEREIHKRILKLSDKETAIWNLDQKINWRGVHVDIPACRVASHIIDDTQKSLDDELRRVSGNRIASYRAHVQVAEWVRSRGVETEGVDKNAVISLLARNDLPSDVRRVLEIRQEAAKSSTAKLKAFLTGTSADGRIRGIFQYHQATTGRWAGRRIQPQNFPRPHLSKEQIEDAFACFNGNGPKIWMKDESWMRIIASCLRGMMCAAPGKILVGADSSSIEARALAWLAGEESVLEIFKTHGKIYEHAAAAIFAVLMSAVSEEERHVGKVSTLALGFQGGVGALHTMATAYRVDLSRALSSLWERADCEIRDRARARYEDKKVIKPAGISKQQWFAAELTKVFWRKANPNIVSYWYAVEKAAMEATASPGSTTTAGAIGAEVKFKKAGSFLFCKLPSGRNLCYPYATLGETTTSWGEKKLALKYMAIDSVTGKWERQTTYGGSIVENITQGVARDVLAEGMLRAEDRGYPIVLHVHDEIVAEVEKGSAKELSDILSVVPPWAPGLPLAAKGWEGQRYQK